MGYGVNLILVAGMIGNTRIMAYRASIDIDLAFGACTLLVRRVKAHKMQRICIVTRTLVVASIMVNLIQPVEDTPMLRIPGSLVLSPRFNR